MSIGTLYSQNQPEYRFPSFNRLRLVPNSPQSVGLAPVPFSLNGALVIAPSINCYSQLRPFFSSYSITPASSQSFKHICFLPFCETIMYCTWHPQTTKKYTISSVRYTVFSLALFLFCQLIYKIKYFSYCFV